MILEALYFFLPAYIANSAPPLMKWIPFNKPINEKLFGNHKTWRGFISACLFGIITFVIQKSLYKFDWIQSISLFDYTQMTIWLGFLLGFGAIFGDLIESYFKRKINIKPGKSWIPFDQIDFAIGGLLFSAIIFIPNLLTMVIIILVSSLITMLFHYSGYLLGINKDKI